MNVPHYINENKSDIRGIKLGWYTLDDSGNLSSGPFASHQECLIGSAELTNKLLESLPRPK